MALLKRTVVVLLFLSLCIAGVQSCGNPLARRYLEGPGGLKRELPRLVTPLPDLTYTFVRGNVACSLNFMEIKSTDGFGPTVEFDSNLPHFTPKYLVMSADALDVSLCWNIEEVVECSSSGPKGRVRFVLDNLQTSTYPVYLGLSRVDGPKPRLVAFFVREPGSVYFVLASDVGESRSSSWIVLALLGEKIDEVFLRGL